MMKIFTAWTLLMGCCVPGLAGQWEWQANAWGPRLTEKERNRRNYGVRDVIRDKSVPALALEVGCGPAPYLLKRGLLCGSRHAAENQSQHTAPFHVFELGDIAPREGFKSQAAVADKGWCHAALVFEDPEQEDANGDPLLLTVTVSRLSPAVVVESTGNDLIFFGGGKIKTTSFTLQTRVATTKTDFVTPSRGMALTETEAVALDAAGTSEDGASIGYEMIEARAFLFWWGQASHAWSSRFLFSYYTGYGNMDTFFQADCPMLIVFQSAPASVTKLESGGLKFHFDGVAGKAAVLPVYGDRLIPAGETEKWAEKEFVALADCAEDKAGGQAAGDMLYDALNRCRWWSKALAHYPVEAIEDYSRDGDKVIVTEKFSYLDLDAESAFYCAPLPTMLAVARLEGFPVEFSGVVSDLEYDVSLGSVQVVENAREYSWSVSGLGRYVDFQRPPTAERGADPVRAGLEEKLAAEINKFPEDGLFAPWIQNTETHWLSGGYAQVGFRFETPAERIVILTQILDNLPSALAARLQPYIDRLRKELPPESAPLAPLLEGVRRERYLTDQPIIAKEYIDKEGGYAKYAENYYLVNELVRSEALYGLAAYYRAVGISDMKDKWPEIREALDPYLLNSDWPSLGWHAWKRGWTLKNSLLQPSPSVEDINAFFAATVGLARLARQAGDADSERLGWGLLAKTAALRFAAGKYCQFLYRRGIIAMPEDPKWMYKFAGSDWCGNLLFAECAAPVQDVRQVAEMDQYGVILLDRRYYMRPGMLNAFQNLTPELGAFLRDYLKPESLMYIRAVEENQPEWHIALAEQFLGAEWNYVLPFNAYQVFLAKLWVEEIPPLDMARYLDVPWCERGDLYYIHKLSEVLR